MTRHSTFLRIARRECWRHRSRSFLILLLVALPVAVAAGGITARSTIVHSPLEERYLDYGSADLVVECPCSSPAGEIEASLIGQLPAGSRLVPMSTLDDLTVVAGDRAARRNEIIATDPTKAMHRPRFRVDAGRLPEAPDEATVSSSLAEDLGVDVGATIELLPGGGELEVVGLVNERARLRDPLVIVLPGRAPTTGWWVDLPTGADGREVASQLASPVVATAVESLLEPPPGTLATTTEISLAYLAGVFVFCWTGVVAAAAFAIGARRRLRQLGLLSANGGSPSQARQLLVADAVVLGLVGSALGAVVGPMATALLLPRLEGTALVPYETGSLNVPWLAVAGTVVVGTICAVASALVPAARAARIPTMAALQARMARPPRHVRSVVGGLVLGGIGVALIGQGTVSEQHLQIAVGTGFVCLAVASLNRFVVAALAGLAKGAGLSLRFAARDAARNSQRTGPAVVASMLAIAATIGMVTVIRSEDATRRPSGHPLDGAVAVTVESESAPGVAVSSLLAEAATATLPAAQIEVTSEASIVARLGHHLSSAEVGRLHAAALRRTDAAIDGPFVMSLEEPPARDRNTGAWQLGIGAIGTALSLLVLGLVAALSRAETKAEMATLHALGISPLRRRRLAAAAAGVLALVAGALAVPTGLVPAVAFLDAKYKTGVEPVIAIPWLLVAAEVVGLTLVMAATGWLAAGRPSRTAS